MNGVLLDVQKKLDELELEVVIGLETHVTITNVENKLFCSCKNQEGDKANVNICELCSGKKGKSPILNKEVIKEAVKLGRAINSKIAKTISFDRKHYNYPDLPKGYQITQYENPIAIGGKVMCFRPDKTNFGVQLDHFHIEEDPAKLTYTKDGLLIDFNRSGRPLLEVVTKPGIHSIEDALYYMEALRRLVRNLGISEADMEKGQFKSDISISLRKKGEESLNARTEIKNMNSFKFSKEAILQEVQRQLNDWIRTGEPKKEQLTVKWNEETEKIEIMRKKENKEDYGVVPEVDIPSLNIESIVKTTLVDVERIPFEIEKK